MATTYTYVNRTNVTGFAAESGLINSQYADELEQSPQMTFENDQASGWREFRVSNGNVVKLAQGLLASSSVSGGAITVNKPCSCSVFGGLVRAYSVNIKPQDQVQTAEVDGSELPTTYDWYRAVAQYRQMPAIEEEFLPAGEFLTLPPQSFRWKSDSVPLLANEAPGRFIIKGTWTVTRHWLPIVPPEYLSLVGKSNSAAIASVRYGWTYPAGTLTCLPAVIRSYYDFAGNLMHSVTARMAYKGDLDSGNNPVGWNKFYRAKTGAYDTIQWGSGSSWTDYQPYGSGDFTPIAVYLQSDL